MVKKEEALVVHHPLENWNNQMDICNNFKS
jgi:hypothetical protein